MLRLATNLMGSHSHPHTPTHTLCKAQKGPLSLPQLIGGLCICGCPSLVVKETTESPWEPGLSPSNHIPHPASLENVKERKIQKMKVKIKEYG
jgi:hypothetical protein